MPGQTRKVGVWTVKPSDSYASMPVTTYTSLGTYIFNCVTFENNCGGKNTGP